MQTTTGLGAGTINDYIGTMTSRDIEDAKWRLWHGRWRGCLIKLARLCHSTDARRIHDMEGIRSLRRHLRDLIAYLKANQSARGAPPGASFRWVAADSVYGVGDIERDLRYLGKGYVLGVDSTRVFRPWGKKRPVAGTAAEIANTLKPSD